MARLIKHYKYVYEVHNLYKRPRSTFIDPVTPGGKVHYRICVGELTEAQQKQMDKEIKRELGIDVMFRRRKGHGWFAGRIDMLIPAYDGDEVPTVGYAY